MTKRFRSGGTGVTADKPELSGRNGVSCSVFSKLFFDLIELRCDSQPREMEYQSRSLLLGESTGGAPQSSGSEHDR